MCCRWVGVWGVRKSEAVCEVGVEGDKGRDKDREIVDRWSRDWWVMFFLRDMGVVEGFRIGERYDLI